MTCRHEPGDPRCSKSAEGQRRIEAEMENHARQRTVVRLKEMEDRSPNPADYQIERAEPVGSHLVVLARYPSCSKCAYEGNKIMVFLNTSAVDGMRWRQLDPHFRANNPRRPSTEAPSPAARFPATSEGWDDAIAYAKRK